MDTIRTDDKPIVTDDVMDGKARAQPYSHHLEVDGTNECPYLRLTATPSAHSSSVPKACYASSHHFVPSNVHQSSCCLNPANFVRCPYYLGVSGKEKRQIDFQLRKRSALARLRDQFVRLLSFRRNPRKRRRRIQII